MKQQLARLVYSFPITLCSLIGQFGQRIVTKTDAVELVVLDLM